MSITNNQSNMIGSYGSWLANKVLGDGPAKLSYRTGQWKNLNEWRKEARKKLIECIAPVDLGGKPEVKVESPFVYDGVHIEKLSWQLPNGPRSEGVFMKPAGAKGKLPAVLGLHDHAGNKFLGWRKIAKTDDKPWEVQALHHKNYYGGLAWANELAKSGYAVLVHDTFPFASRRVKVSEVSERIRQNGVDPEPTDLEGINKYNSFAGNHENIMEKSLICAGTTWPGVYVVEDQKALDILCARPEVDVNRVGCGGLSGGGMRTVYLNAIDDRIRCAIPSGFMTTWRDFLVDKCFTHTWMIFTPLLPQYLDFPELLALNSNSATLVLNCVEDPLFTLPEMKRADQMLRETYDKGGDSSSYRCNFYPGGHKFDATMQKDAFTWFDQHLKNRKV